MIKQLTYYPHDSWGKPREHLVHGINRRMGAPAITKTYNMKHNQLPHYILLEFLGQFTLLGNEEAQVKIAEEIASNTYNDLDDLADTIKGYAPKNKFKRQLIEVKSSEFFKPYWRYETETKA